MMQIYLNRIHSYSIYPKRNILLGLGKQFFAAIFLGLVLVATAQAQTDTNSFISSGQTTADNDAISFPGEGRYTIDWGDSSTETVSGPIDHTNAPVVEPC